MNQEKKCKEKKVQYINRITWWQEYLSQLMLFIEYLIDSRHRARHKGKQNQTWLCSCEAYRATGKKKQQLNTEVKWSHEWQAPGKCSASAMRVTRYLVGGQASYPPGCDSRPVIWRPWLGELGKKQKSTPGWVSRLHGGFVTTAIPDKGLKKAHMAGAADLGSTEG